ncbi:hypothetical protein V8G54_023568 [Vigna mungo]|uniref:FAD-binding domain-containing protein n=1 Tax=Vigna mungo TaxID=3915 RepID=A0AAQ3RQF5_VIGMU
MASVQILCACTSSSKVQQQGSIRYRYGYPSEKMNGRRCSVRVEGGNGMVVPSSEEEKRKLRVLVAGGGIGGLVFALAAKHKGYAVKVFEKDLSAVRGEGRHRGPIQLLSSALAVLEAIDQSVAWKIKEAGCVTANRTNGLADGLSGEWFGEFDLLTPASKKRLPLTLVICRITLQDILVNAVGPNILRNKSKVVDFIQEPSKVRVMLENGEQHEGDILIGADGIWFVRNSLGAKKQITQMLAMERCNVSAGKKKRLLDLFGNWCNEVIALISETPENMILQRDIYDRDMINTWGIDRVTLLGDAAHPMQPNLGQGGCMAIEDSYQLILELDKIAKHDPDESEVISALRRYEKKRIPRVKVLHTASRMASKMLVNYQPYIEFKFWPLSENAINIQIKHPGIQVAEALFKFTFPQFVSWMMAGHGYQFLQNFFNPLSCFSY